MRLPARALALAVLAACGGEKSKAPAASSGAALFKSQGCVTCHAADGTGTSFGPTLLGKKQHWTRENLVVYLKDPVAYAAKDPRLHEQSKRFTLPMLRFDKLPEEELSALADHVLGLP